MPVPINLVRAKLMLERLLRVLLEQETINPAYFVIGGIMGCVPIAYWLVQSCQVRCILCSALAFVVRRIHVHAACFCLLCPLGLQQTDSGRNPPASAPNSRSARSEQCRRAGTSRIPCWQTQKAQCGAGASCRQTGPAHHLMLFPLASSLLNTPGELTCRWQPLTARYNLCWDHPLSCPQPASREAAPV